MYSSAWKLQKELDLLVSKRFQLKDLQTVCLTLGPYRNLTTLTASLLFLHPECQVLNHAGIRIFGDKRLDFFKDYNDKKFRNFTQYSIHISQKGRSGLYGGSITHSHAFHEPHLVKNLFRATGGKLLKPHIRSLFWKESLLTSNHLRQRGTDFTELFSRNSKLRFLLPVRNPLDCAVSNLKSGHVRLFRGANANHDIFSTTRLILEEFKWIDDLRSRYPERFLVVFAHSFSERTLKDLAGFLKISDDPSWRNNALKAFQLKGSYDHAEPLLRYYRSIVEKIFERSPEFGEQLLKFLPTAN